MIRPVPLRLKIEFSIFNLSQHFINVVIHRQVPLPVPCYDFILVTDLSLGPANAGTSTIAGFPNVTGGEYKIQERIHRHIADWRLLAIPAS